MLLENFILLLDFEILHSFTFKTFSIFLNIYVWINTSVLKLTITWKNLFEVGSDIQKLGKHYLAVYC